MKIMFCGGGTAGHITPAIAIAETLLKRDKNTEVLFVCREGGSENEAVIKKNYKMKTIKICGFERKLSLNNAKNVLTVIKAIRLSKKIISDFCPDVVIGTGGYVTFPVIRAAQKMKIPTLIHESNACPGLVTKLLAPKCTRVLLNLKGSESEFKNKHNIKIVGNPIREDFMISNKSSARRKLGISQNDFLISSFGGSGGSEKINDAVISLMNSHSSKSKRIRHIHSCGLKYYSKIKNDYPHLVSGKNGCIIKPYIYDISNVILASDLIISRCGAMTLTEICASGSSAILIPSPNVTNNHQYKNAKLLSDAGAAIMIEESELNDRVLLDTVRKLEGDTELRKKFSEKISALYVGNSNELIANEILSIIDHSALK